MLNYLLTPEAQATTYDKGYFYPGPARKDVTLAMAPQESQDAIKEFGRPEYEKLIADFLEALDIGIGALKEQTVSA